MNVQETYEWILIEAKCASISKMQMMIENEGGIVQINKKIGGRNQLGFNSQVIVDKVYVSNTLFSGTHLCASINHQEFDFADLSLDKIQAIAKLMDAINDNLYM